MDYTLSRIKYENEFLSQYASKVSNTKGREKAIAPCPLRTEYQRDRDRIVHSKSFRRLKHKTQVFLSPEGDHYRTRLTHTLEVTQIARTISRALGLNEDLSEAIAMGHDIGHTPFGHAGERVLRDLTNGYFEHNKQSLRVVDVLESNDIGEHIGLNLTYEVKDGILNHRIKDKPQTLEGVVVSFSDRIAYINHDIDDLVRAGILKEKDLPKEALDILGYGKSFRINNMVKNIIECSYNNPYVIQNEEYSKATTIIRDYMMEKFYSGASPAKTEEIKAEKIVEFFYKLYMAYPEKLPNSYKNLLDKYDRYIVICDYIASMTDRYLVRMFEKENVPIYWQY